MCFKMESSISFVSDIYFNFFLNFAKEKFSTIYRTQVSSVHDFAIHVAARSIAYRNVLLVIVCLYQVLSLQAWNFKIIHFHP